MYLGNMVIVIISKTIRIIDFFNYMNKDILFGIKTCAKAIYYIFVVIVIVITSVDDE